MKKISDYLKNDHARCDDLFTQTEFYVNQKRWDDAQISFNLFRDFLNKHINIEESIIFPALEYAIDSATGPTNIMRMEHVYIRGINHHLYESINKKNTVSFFDHSDTLQLILQQHNLKEEDTWYAMIDRALNSTKNEVIHAMKAIYLNESVIAEHLT